jgi:hypothetical protein
MLTIRGAECARSRIEGEVMSDDEGPIKLEMITGVSAVFLDNPSVGPPGIRPILTLNLEDQFGRAVLLPLSDTVLPRLLDILAFRATQNAIDLIIKQSPSSYSGWAD